MKSHAWHNVRPEDQARIQCQKGDCGKPATICEHAHISFWYFCEEHGSGLREVLPEFRAADSGTSPRGATWEGKPVVRVASHRARHKLDRICAGDSLFTWDAGGVFRAVPPESLPAALAITGITRARVQSDKLSRCWKF
jgi:hypothetical protein